MGSLVDIDIQNAISKATRSGKDVWLTDGLRSRGVGRLRLRVGPAGNAAFLFRYNDSEGKQRHLSIGIYDRSGRSGYTLKAARERAGEISRRYQAGERDLHIHLAHERAEQLEKKQEAQRQREQAERDASSGTMRALLDGYIAHLERQGKVSYRDVRSIVNRNVYEAFREMADMKAASVTIKDCNSILSSLLKDRKGRTAAKLRSFGRAAYALALQADYDPTVPEALRGFELTTNPWAMLPAKSFSQFNNALDRTLSESELKSYMIRLDGIDNSVTRDALWLALLLGGQRPTQLLRVTRADIDLDGKTILLRDGKGARKRPRAHLLPLPPRAAKIVTSNMAMNVQSCNEAPAFLLTNTGRAPVSLSTLSKAAAGIAKDMLSANEARAPFAQRDIRRTAETQMAALGVTKDVRAQILSHGLGGLQDRHYDRHAYMDEKRDALLLWDRWLKRITKRKRKTSKG